MCPFRDTSVGLVKALLSLLTLNITLITASKLCLSLTPQHSSLKLSLCFSLSAMLCVCLFLFVSYLPLYFLYSLYFYCLPLSLLFLSSFPLPLWFITTVLGHIAVSNPLKAFRVLSWNLINLGLYKTTSCITHKIHLCEPAWQRALWKISAEDGAMVWFTNASQLLDHRYSAFLACDFIEWETPETHTFPPAICTNLYYACSIHAYWCACSLRLI